MAYAPAPGGYYYDYDYYPGWNVYFYPSGRLYYWNEGGHWRSGRRLPPRYHFREAPHEHLRLHTQHPWTENHPEPGGNRPEGGGNHPMHGGNHPEHGPTGREHNYR